MSSIDIYNSCRTDRVSKENSALIINSYIGSIKPDCRDDRIRSVFWRIGYFKKFRDENKSDTYSQTKLLDALNESIAEGYAEISPSANQKKIKLAKCTEVFASCCTVMKNDGFLKVKIPQTLKFLVIKYEEQLREWSNTPQIDYLLTNSKDLSNDNRNRLSSLEQARAKSFIVGQFRQYKADMNTVSPNDFILKPIIAEVLDNVTKAFTLVPTAEWADNYSDYNPKNNPILKNTQYENEARYKDMMAFQDALCDLMDSQGEFRPNKNINDPNRLYENIGASIKSKIGSCMEFATLLAVVIRNDQRLASITDRVFRYRLKFPDDHTMVAIEDFCGPGKTLILDAWLKHITLKNKIGYRPEDVDKNDANRRGFMGGISEYKKFLNDHESERFVLNRQVYNFPEHVLEKVPVLGLDPKQERRIYAKFTGLKRPRPMPII